MATRSTSAPARAASKPAAKKTVVKTASAARSAPVAAHPVPPAAELGPVAAAVESVATPGVQAAPADTAKAAGTKAAKADKPKKPKLVRDSFTIPKAEYAVLEALKARAARSGSAAKKSEVLRAGIKALSGMDDAAFAVAMGAVPALKTGRPAKG